MSQCGPNCGQNSNPDSPDENPANCITSVPVFRSLSADEMLEIALITQSRTYRKGDWIYQVGDRGGKLYVLHTGRVKISRISANGKEQVIRVIGSGDFMGELSLFSSQPLTDNAQAMETSTMCVIHGDNVKELMGKYPSIALKIMDELSKRLEKAENLIEAINFNTVEQRLAQALLSLSDPDGTVDLPMTRGDLASQLGMSQETLSRKLATFQEAEIIELISPRKLRILDRAGLEDILVTV